MSASTGPNPPPHLHNPAGSKRSARDSELPSTDTATIHKRRKGATALAGTHVAAAAVAASVVASVAAAPASAVVAPSAAVTAAIVDARISSTIDATMAHAQAQKEIQAVRESLAFPLRG